MTETNNLPIALTRFIGREKEIAEVKRLLDLPGLGDLEGLRVARLLTLTGAGGAGKTRLAIQVAQDLTGLANLSGLGFPDGVWLIELASLADPALVPQTVATIFDLRASGNLAPMDLLKNFLHTKNLLLVLDNCEHLIDACAQLAESLLTHCPDVKILATSREALNIAGEITFRVPSLAVANPQQLPPLEAFAQVQAIHLFVERAHAVQPGFELTDANKSFIAQICARLDGMPLALELAAARVKMLSVEQIAARLDGVFDLLTRGTRTAPTRQQTLRATMDWSFDLLDEPERILFRRLAVFAGGFTLEQVEAICADDGIGTADILDVLADLVDKSLVNVVTYNQVTARYRMLETIRQYAREKLLQANELNATRSLHLRYFLHLAKKADAYLHRPEREQWLNQLQVEHDNLRSGWAWAIENDLEHALDLARALQSFWFTGHLGEATACANQLLAKLEKGGHDHRRAQTLILAANVANMKIDHATANPLYEAGLAIAQTIGNCALIEYALTGLGIGKIASGEFEHARTNLTAALSLSRASGDEWNQIRILRFLGILAFQQNEFVAARDYLDQAITRARAVGDQHSLASVLNSLGVLLFKQNDLSGAASAYEETLAVCKNIPSGNMRIAAIRGLAEIALRNRDMARAKNLLEECAVYYQQQGITTGLAWCLMVYIELAMAVNQPRAAARWLGAAHSARDAFSALHLAGKPEAYTRLEQRVRPMLGQTEFEIAWKMGKTLTIAQAIDESLKIKVPDQSPPTLKGKLNGITAREREVAALIAHGKTNREIADALVLSERTIEGHVSNILTKLNFATRAQIAAWAVEQGLFQSADQT